MFDWDIMWTCSRCFPYSLRPGLFAIKGVNVENACIRGAKGIYAGGASAVKYSKIYLQLS